MSETAGAINKGYLSDNAAGTSQQILNAISTANLGQAAPYGNDQLSLSVTQLFAEIFEHSVDVFPVSTGSAANAIALASMTPTWGAILSHPAGHINNDEAGAPEFFSNGAKMLLIDGPDTKISAAELLAVVSKKRGDVHTVQPSVLSLSQTTETGSVYTLAELTELSAIAHGAGLSVHMDGARFANALVSLNVSPSEMTWKAGIDVLSFGATKNGAMTADAIVSFDSNRRTELAYRHKRGGQLTSKMRFQTAQLGAYLDGGLWLNNAKQANAMALKLKNGLSQIAGVTLLGDSKSNILFCKIPPSIAAQLKEQGFGFYDNRWEKDVVRLVTSFAHTEQDIDALLGAAGRLSAGAQK